MTEKLPMENGRKENQTNADFSIYIVYSWTHPLPQKRGVAIFSLKRVRGWGGGGYLEKREHHLFSY